MKAPSTLLLVLTVAILSGTSGQTSFSDDETTVESSATAVSFDIHSSEEAFVSITFTPFTAMANNVPLNLEDLGISFTIADTNGPTRTNVPFEISHPNGVDISQYSFIVYPNRGVIVYRNSGMGLHELMTIDGRGATGLAIAKLAAASFAVVVNSERQEMSAYLIEVSQESPATITGMTLIDRMSMPIIPTSLSVAQSSSSQADLIVVSSTSTLLYSFNAVSGFNDLDTVILDEAAVNGAMSFEVSLESFLVTMGQDIKVLKRNAQDSFNVMQTIFSPVTVNDIHVFTGVITNQERTFLAVASADGVNVYEWFPSGFQLLQNIDFDGAMGVEGFSFQRDVYLAIVGTSTGSVWTFVAGNTQTFEQTAASLPVAATVSSFTPLGVNSIELCLTSGDPMDEATATQSTDVDSVSLVSSVRLFLTASDPGNDYFDGEIRLDLFNSSTVTAMIPLFPPSGFEAAEHFFVNIAGTESPDFLEDVFQVNILGNADLNPTVANQMVTIREDESPRFDPDPPIAVVSFNTAADMTYSIVEGDTTNSFIVEEGGSVRFTKALDRETEDAYFLLIRGVTKGAGLTGLAWVIVTIEDVNDNQPTFIGNINNGRSFLVSVKEGVAPGPILLVKVEDLDLTNDIVISIVNINPPLYNGQIPFTLNETSGILSSTVSLDRENPSLSTGRFTIRVAAQDGTLPIPITTSVFVNIEDVNEAAPSISPSFVPVILRENDQETPKRTVLANFAVTDTDLTSNIVVSFDAGDQQGQFEVEEEGSLHNLVFTGIVDFETGPRHLDVVLTACDGIFCSNANVSIDVVDVNDNSPAFRGLTTIDAVSQLGSDNSLEFVEGASTIGFVQAEDEDSDQNAQITYRAETNNVVTINSTTGELIALISPPGTYEVTIVATDNGSPMKSAEQTIRLVVLDNISVQPAVLDLAEEAIPSTHVESVASLIDALVVPAARMSFKMEDPTSVFMIDSVSGDITVRNNTMLDFEGPGLKRFVLKVTVTDFERKSIGRFTDATIIINVVNINDNRPILSPSLLDLSIFEDDATQSFVDSRSIVQLEASDLDGDDLRYAIISSTAQKRTSSSLPVNLFEVDDQGLVNAVEPLDAELYSSFQITIQVSDEDIPRLDDPTVTITVNLIDVNDNEPKFPQSSFSYNLFEGNASGTVVGSFLVSDADITPSSLTISIQNPFNTSSEDQFSATLAGSTVTIRLNGTVDFESVQTHQFFVEASDGKFDTRTFISIAVQNSNEFAPRFTLPINSFNIRENTAFPTVVVDLVAEDGDNDDLIFSITKGEDLGFELIEGNRIVTTRSFDREVDGSLLLLSFRVEDALGLADTIEDFQIVIEDENDNSPIFQFSDYSFQLEEGLAPGLINQTLVATDKDSDVFAPILYRIESDRTNAFSIHVSTGVLSTTRELDRETDGAIIRFVVIASDNSLGNSNETPVVVTVRIQDVNDFRPEFPAPVLNFTVKENSVDVGTLVAVDGDALPPANTLQYSILSDPSEAFTIGSTNGKLVFKRNIDFEEEGSTPIYAKVQAQDLGTPSLQTEVDVYVVVTNENDLPPVAEDGVFAVEENVEDQFVGPLIVNDPDGDELSFSLVSVVPSTSKLSVNGPFVHILTALDREQVDLYRITFQISDSVHPPVFATMTITVEDQNDNVPLFINLPATVTIEEEAQPTNSPIFRALSRDNDVGSFGSVVDYKIREGDDFGKFRISSSGALFLVSSLDAEVTSQYNLTIEAVDGGGKSATEVLIIVVQDVNDRAPVFSPISQLVPSVTEDTIGEIAVAQASDDDISAPNNRVHYSIVSDPSTQLTINELSGVISLKAPLDRESYPNGLVVVIRAKDGGIPEGNADDLQYTISIADLNDASPVFQNLPFSTSVQEGLQPNTTIFTVFAIDNDEDVDGKATVRYKLAEPSDQLQIDEKSGKIRTVGILDRERNPGNAISISIVAYDMGIPQQQSDKVSFDLTIIDINDNQPEFEFPSYQGQIRELDARGSPVLNSAGDTALLVVARDLDEGENSRLQYSVSYVAGVLVSNGSRVEFSPSIFRIGPTGLIRRDDEGIPTTASMPFDREIYSRFEVIVVATDHGTDPKSAQTEVTIDILDGNDNEPIVSPAKFDVMENFVGSVGFIEAVDSDQGENAILRYTIASSTSSGNFSIDEETGELFINIPLDYEELRLITLEAVVFDSGSSPLSGIGSVEIHIQDENDVDPQFDFGTYSEHVLEGVTKDLLTVHASDPDTGAGGDISYSIDQGTFSDRFKVNEESGLVSLVNPFDREEDGRTFSVSIRATDGGGRSTSVLLFGSVLDINDSPPIFSPSTVTFGVREHSGAQVLGRVVATDQDDFSSITYSILEENVSEFSVSPQTGDVSVTQDLDRERNATFYFTVVASDGTAATIDGHLSVTVRVLDVNDNAPILGQAIYQLSVFENVLPGAVLDVLTASDSDLNDAVTFKMVNPDARRSTSLFQVLPDGSIIVADNLNAETTMLISFQVIAVDQAGQESRPSFVEIEIKDVNEFKPDFKTATLDKQISEATAVGETVLVIKADDADVGEFGEIVEYTISGIDAAPFKIESDGSLVLLTTLDYDTGKVEYAFTVAAKDIEGFEGLGTVTITLVDENDEFPLFRAPITNVTLYEEPPFESMVGEFIAIDGDATEAFRSLTYFIDPTFEDGDLFRLDGAGAVVTFAVPERFDIDEGNTFRRFRLTATDAVGNSGETVVTVILQDINDNAPIIQGGDSDFVRSLQETVAVNTTVFAFSGEDSDAGLNGEITWTITSGNEDGSFGITDTGNVIVRVPLDFESGKVFYQLEITATDRALPSDQKSSTVQLQIHVLDGNDMGPEILAPFSAEIVENFADSTNIDRFVMQVLARDTDSGSEVARFEILNNVPFEINSRGQIFTTEPLDAERQSMYEVSIAAFDNGTPSLRGQPAMIRVAVGDLNDNPPISCRDHDIATISESSKPGEIVMDVAHKLSDADVSNDALRYNIISGNCNNSFVMHPSSGQLVLAKALSRKDAAIHRILVGIHDGANFVTFRVTVMIRPNTIEAARAVINRLVSLNPTSPDRIPFSSTTSGPTVNSVPVTSQTIKPTVECLNGEEQEIHRCENGSTIVIVETCFYNGWIMTRKDRVPCSPIASTCQVINPPLPVLGECCETCGDITTATTTASTTATSTVTSTATSTGLEGKVPRVHTKSGAPCQFPFRFEGVAYDSCLPITQGSSRYWCSLVEDFDTTQPWGECDISQVFVVTTKTKTVSHPNFGIGATDGFALQPIGSSDSPVEGQTLTLEAEKTYAFQTQQSNTDFPLYILSGNDIVVDAQVQNSGAVGGDTLFLTPSKHNFPTPTSYDTFTNGPASAGGLIDIFIVDTPSTTTGPTSPDSIFIKDDGPTVRVCNFPFDYKGVTYTNCACDEDNNLGPFCFTADNVFGFCDIETSCAELRAMAVAAGGVARGHDSTLSDTQSDTYGAEAEDRNNGRSDSSQATTAIITTAVCIVAALVVAVVLKKRNSGQHSSKIAVDDTPRVSLKPVPFEAFLTNKDDEEAADIGPIHRMTGYRHEPSF